MEALVYGSKVTLEVGEGHILWINPSHIIQGSEKVGFDHFAGNLVALTEG